MRHDAFALLRCQVRPTWSQGHETALRDLVMFTLSNTREGINEPFFFLKFQRLLGRYTLRSFGLYAKQARSRSAWLRKHFFRFQILTHKKWRRLFSRVQEGAFSQFGWRNCSSLLFINFFAALCFDECQKNVSLQPLDCKTQTGYTRLFEIISDRRVTSGNGCRLQIGRGFAQPCG